MTVTEMIKQYANEKDAEFVAKLIPDKERELFLGVKTPPLKALAKELVSDGRAEDFLAELPHRYFEEYQLHAFIISIIKDYSKALELTELFLPYVDNWATCDQLRPTAFKKHRSELIEHVRHWIASEHTYTKRFGLGMLMVHYLDSDFLPEYTDLAASVRSDEYYVNMMTAWYFATALAKQYDTAVKYIEERRLAPWVHNKAIQKARESFRVTDEHKEYLKSLKINGVK